MLLAGWSDVPCRRVFWSEGHAAAVLHPSGLVAWARRRAYRSYDAFAVPNARSADWARAHGRLTVRRGATVIEFIGQDPFETDSHRPGCRRRCFARRIPRRHACSVAAVGIRSAPGHRIQQRHRIDAPRVGHRILRARREHRREPDGGAVVGSLSRRRNDPDSDPEDEGHKGNEGDQGAGEFAHRRPILPLVQEQHPHRRHGFRLRARAFGEHQFLLRVVQQP